MMLRRIMVICDPGGTRPFRDFMREPGLMWSPWMSARFHILRNDIVDHNITLAEIVGMWDAVKE